MLRIGFVGWRGMVGSVLMQRMKLENDFSGFEPMFFSTSNVGGAGPDMGMDVPALKDAFDVETLSALDIIVTCQGSGYTRKIYKKLREDGWKGYWIDAASTLRMADDSAIVLDPVNMDVITEALASGVRTFCGGNCTVSLMLMALSGLFEKGLVEWISSMTYQAASGAGAKNMKELAAQMTALGLCTKDLVDDPAVSALEIDAAVSRGLSDPNFPTENFGAPLAASLIPWIDSFIRETGQTREEWKGAVETAKILQTEKAIPIDGICVRVGSMRCHSQALTVRLNSNVPLDEIEGMIADGNTWAELVPNNREATLQRLAPAAVNGSLTVPVGRVRKMLMGPEYVTAFTVGDQLLWGAAEPIRRILNIVRKN